MARVAACCSELKSFAASTRFGDPAGHVELSGALAAGAAAQREMLEGKDGGTPLVPNSVPAEAFDAVKKAAGRAIDIMITCCGSENTLVHMDVRLDNMIFLDDAEKSFLLLDWQQYSSGWNIADVTQFILFNLNREGATSADLELELLEE